MKKFGYRLLQITGYLVLLGGVFDIAMTFYSKTLPQTHLDYLKLKNELVPVELKNLDIAFLRAIGGCLIGIGLGTLTIIYGGHKNMPKLSIIGILSMITVAEGINASQMFLLSSPYFIFPLLCVILTWIGALLWFLGNSRRLN